jgi:hypothetical protein
MCDRLNMKGVDGVPLRRCPRVIRCADTLLPLFDSLGVYGGLDGGLKTEPV